MHPLLRRIGRNGAVFGALVVLAHCGGTDLTLPSDTSPATISKIDGDKQNGSAGAALDAPLIVKVIDRRSKPVANLRVAFTIDGDVSDALITPAETRTDTAGLARAEWKVGGTLGTQAVIASVVGFDDLPPVRFEASVESAEAQRIESFNGNAQTGAVGAPLASPLVVRVIDQFGNPVANVDVEWEAENGSIDPSSSTTGADGLATASWVLGGSTGPQAASASSDGLENSPVNFTGTAVAGSASRLVYVSGNNQSADPARELDDPLVVRLIDQEGNGVPERAVTWVVGAGGGSVASSTSTTDGDGEARISWTLGPAAGVNTLNAVVSGVGVIPFLATAVSGGGGGGGGGNPRPTRLEFVVQPSDTERDRKISPSVEVAVLDQNGNRVTEDEFQITLELSGDDDDKLDGDTRERTRSGVATFDIEIDEEGEYRLRAVADELQSAESDVFQIHDRDDD